MKELTLIKPCRPKFDAQLMFDVETKRLHLPTFSDAHWTMQLLIEYQNLFKGNKDGTDLSSWGAMTAAAIDDVFRTLLRAGEKAAIQRAQALKNNGYPILTWFPGPGTDEEWTKVRKIILKHGKYHYTVDGD